jgi:acetyl esterase
MTLDPDVERLLNQFKDVPPLKETPVQIARKWELEYAKASNPVVEQVEKVEDKGIQGRETNIPIRVYTPIAQPVGTVVFYHGGGFVLGGIETHDQLCRRLANASECRLVSVEYRLAPEHKFPAAVTDSYDAFRWATQNFEGEVCVAGDSAGGNLAAVVAQLAKENGDRQPSLQVLIYPVLNLLGVEKSVTDFAEGYFLTLEEMLWFRRQYLSSDADAANPLASPMLTPDLSELPPAIIVTAEYDPLRDQGEAYSALLRKAGVTVLGLRYTGVTHGFMSFPITAGAAATEALASFIRTSLNQKARRKTRVAERSGSGSGSG